MRSQLPPHPNIVDMKEVFADQVPEITEAMSLFPDALPRRYWKILQNVLNFLKSGLFLGLIQMALVET